jgi:hypothetical protein
MENFLRLSALAAGVLLPNTHAPPLIDRDRIAGDFV